MKRKFITGYTGYIGSELLERGFEPLACELTKYESVNSAIQKAKPDLLVHLAGKSKIDWCEEKRNQEEVIKTNVRGSYYVFQTLQSLRLPGVLLSSDHIWKGGLFESHREHSKLTPSVNFYGMSKVAAEAVAQNFGMNIIRTSYLFDKTRIEKDINFIRAGMAKSYPVFIKRSFLHLKDFCDMLDIYCDKFYSMPKILHLSGSEVISWRKFMRGVSGHYKGGFIKPQFLDKKNLSPRPWFGGLNISKSIELGFPRKSYIDGIKRLDES